MSEKPIDLDSHRDPLATLRDMEPEARASVLAGEVAIWRQRALLAEARLTRMRDLIDQARAYMEGFR